MGKMMLGPPKTQLASKNLVKEFYEMEPAPHDRPLSERRLLVYRRILDEGSFRPVTWASAVCLETNCTYRVNGKHTATLLHEKLDNLPELHIIVERWQCDTLRDVAALYGTFDSSIASRTTKDINASFAATIPELTGLPSLYINMTVTANANLKYDENMLKRISPAEKAEHLIDRVDFVLWLRDIVTNTSGTSGSRWMLRAPVVQAMMATYDRSPNKARDFWILVKDESAPERDDATRTLARYLIRVIIAGGNMSKPGDRKIVTPREIYAKCIHAWNAWRRNETTSLNYFAKAPLPVPSK